ncbi:MAG: type III pantothenate kinase [Nitrospiraceae bacterium]|nr:MAG: type III pantothenate kinase [Nitrospiraceae bacterium]
MVIADMLLLINIGNTRTTVGFHEDGALIDVLRLATVIDGRSSDEYAYILQGFMRDRCMGRPDSAVLCSVVPPVTPVIAGALKKSFAVRAVQLTSRTGTGLKFSIRERARLGADRIANAVAAHKLYPGNVMVVDFGTATTICAITRKGEYLGGAILPGVGLAARALAEKTAQLPSVVLESPQRALGKNTRENLLSGIIRGHAGAVERIASDIQAETGKTYTVVATGGFADLLRPLISIIDDTNPHLTLQGLLFIHEMHSQKNTSRQRRHK